MNEIIDNEIDVNLVSESELYDLSDYVYKKHNDSPLDNLLIQKAVLEPHAPEHYLLKALKAYKLYKYKSSLGYIEDYEKAIYRTCLRNNQKFFIGIQEKSVIL